ncbi:MAG: hypothetical protein FGM15_11335 [Chthoniobacterales bacterium]|nr:hypothetical protein [Chthoniobacterales bacterium]
MSTSQKLTGKRVLVADSGIGIGREIALEFARQGDDGGTTSLMSLISDFRNRSGARLGAGYVPSL